MFVEQNVTGTKYGHAWGFYCSQWGVLAEVGRQNVMHTGKQTLFLHFHLSVKVRYSRAQTLAATNKQTATNNVFDTREEAVEPVSNYVPI